jgi:hypothetical protein
VNSSAVERIPFVAFGLQRPLLKAAETLDGQDVQIDQRVTETRCTREYLGPQFTLAKAFAFGAGVRLRP